MTHWMIFDRNRHRHARFMNNPVQVFGQRMKDFTPDFAGRYRRSMKYWKIGYGVVVALLLIIIHMLLARRWFSLLRQSPP
ncbi:hypothetical protein [Paraburkholderia ginsengisoli]|uniref:Uncharacterized protein n=1 Tax=Paraburkholderia ginsengisoli TaxID=311231 RepID=A0A7T4N4I9_9BURK|nr:hypothetical protein [Paraburkholderia ginsengisoli]QQC65108.1 hypothetical protein I6I06_06475 [Paraburkholderia ginsengisoli]